MAAPRGFLEADECWAERRGESQCEASGCENLDCPSPADDCSDIPTVCMDDGTCREAAEGGGCPTGFNEMDGICVQN